VCWSRFCPTIAETNSDYQSVTLSSLVEMAQPIISVSRSRPRKKLSERLNAPGEPGFGKSAENCSLLVAYWTNRQKVQVSRYGTQKLPVSLNLLDCLTAVM